MGTDVASSKQPKPAGHAPALVVTPAPLREEKEPGRCVWLPAGGLACLCWCPPCAYGMNTASIHHKEHAPKNFQFFEKKMCRHVFLQPREAAFAAPFVLGYFVAVPGYCQEARRGSEEGRRPV